MKRFNSIQNIPAGQLVQLPPRLVNSLPNLEFIAESSAAVSNISSAEVKHQNSRKVKILQKTWDKVMTIIHPPGRQNSRTKQSPVDYPDSPHPIYSPVVGKFFKSSPSSSAPNTPNKRLVFDFEPISRNEGKAQSAEAEMDQVVKSYVELQKRLSDELHQAINTDKRKEEALSEDFKKKLQQWEMWKASTGKSQYTPDELQKLIPVEFSKKLQEWEEIKSRPRDDSSQSPFLASSNTNTSKNGRRKKKKSNNESQREKELAWLEKQLDKIEVEKKRLEREMVKYCEKEARLQKMREALRNNLDPKQEVWIKTPTAECKVEGISDKFTKKLYKWEEKKGIQPECSTMALLNPKYFSSTPEQRTPSAEACSPLSDPDESHIERTSKDYSSESDHDPDEDYEEATDSFAAKDEPASGTSNTDSDCFNLKPGFRRRSSDAISSPLSSARSPSPSCCTSDEEENFMLQTVSENEEEKFEDTKPIFPIVKAKSILLSDENEPPEDSVVIVKTQRIIFSPVDTECAEGTQDSKVLIQTASSGLSSPKLVKSISDKFSKVDPEVTPRKQAYATELSSYRKMDPGSPRVVGAVRKSSTASSTTFTLPPIPVQNPITIKDGSKPILGKIPVWCSPLMVRRRLSGAKVPPEKLIPQQEFTLDKFLESNAIPVPPPRPSRLPLTSGSPGCSRKKYKLSSGSSELRQETEKVRLLRLPRSSSFQERRTGAGFHSQEVQNPEKGKVKDQFPNASNQSPPKPELPLLSTTSVTKSKSTGSILGNAGTRGLFGAKTQKSEPKQKRQLLPLWLKNPTRH